MSNILDTYSLKQVARFVDGLTKLSNNTGVTIYAESENARLRLDGVDIGLRLADSDFDNSGYEVEIDGGSDG